MNTADIYHPRISVVMATYNGAKFLSRQLDSILEQSLPADEIIIVDDCSHDSTVTLIQEYKNSHPEISLIRNLENIGSNRTFEKALQASTGDLMLISDQDDIWLPEKIHRMVNIWRDQKSGLTCCDGIIIDSEGAVLETSELNFHGQAQVLTNQISLLFANSYSGHNMMLTRDFFLKSQPFPVGPHYDQWLAIVAAGFDDLHYMTDKLTLHRIHGGNQVNGSSKSRRNPNRKARFHISRQTIYQLSLAVLQLPHKQPAISVAKIFLKQRAQSYSFFSFSTFFKLLAIKNQILPNDRIGKQLRKIKNYSRGPMGYFL